MAEALLGLPDEAISREFREKLMRLLVSAVAARVEGGSGSTDTIKPIVSLMVKLMRRPTFYSVCLSGFGHIRRFTDADLPPGHGLLRYQFCCHGYSTEFDLCSGPAPSVPAFGARASSIDA